MALGGGATLGKHSRGNDDFCGVSLGGGVAFDGTLASGYNARMAVCSDKMSTSAYLTGH